MPGERLICVWQAAFAQNVDTMETKLTKKALQDVVSRLDELSTVHFSKTKFDQAFPDDKAVTLATFKRYVFDTLREKGSPQCLLQEEIEQKCWELSKHACKTKKMTDDNVQKLWLINNRLTTEDSFPPVVCQGAADWFSDKICTILGKNWKSKSIKEKASYTFSALLDRLVDDMFSDEPEGAINKCIDDLHKWLVCEVMKSGWLYKRTRKQANWTNWVKRWFVLTSNRVSYYDSASLKGSVKKRGEIFITGSKLETLPPYKGMIHKLEGRFRLSNPPYIELEMAAESNGLRRSWMASLEEVIDASKVNTTPIQRLLKDRWDSNREANGQVVNKLDQAEQKARSASSSEPEIIKAEKHIPISGQPKPQVLDKGPSQDSAGGSDDETFDNAARGNMVKYSDEKMRAVFMKMDKDGNGKIDEREFQIFIAELGLNITGKEIKLLYKAVDKDGNGFIYYGEFADYFANTLMDEESASLPETKLRKAFLEADRDGTGTLNFKEFAEFLSEKKRSIRMSKLIHAFDDMDHKQDGQVNFSQFRNFYKNRISQIPEAISEEEETDEEETGLTAVERQLKTFYKEADGVELAKFIRDRWNKFATFKRFGASGELAMKGGHGMVDDIVPGEYNLIDLACFSDLPPLIPKHTVVKGVKWTSSPSPGGHGKMIFPSDFNGKILTDTATPEHLRYYGCSFAEGNQLKISLLYRHGIQDFTYENKYLEDYVQAANGGAGIEHHDFSHLDCPLEEDSGIFILAKLVGDDEFHLTGFKVPTRHTLYIPGGVIHSNDYLKGTWRTMLSDEADIDHVHLVRKSTKPNGDYEHFQLQFVL